MTINLSQSSGSLISDVTGEGAGVKMSSQSKFKLMLRAQCQSLTGNQILVPSMAEITAKSDVVIYADLDDVLINSQLCQIRVSGCELDRAKIAFVFGGLSRQASVKNGSNRVTFAHDCVS
jgi:2-C-methyl-D-erythritol 4-phosphate cytidylyltransferase